MTQFRFKKLYLYIKKKLIIFEEDLKKSRFLWRKTQESEGIQGRDFYYINIIIGVGLCMAGAIKGYKVKNTLDFT